MFGYDAWLCVVQLLYSQLNKQVKIKILDTVSNKACRWQLGINHLSLIVIQVTDTEWI